MKTFIFCTDLHGDHQNPDAVDAVHRFVQKMNPDLRIFGGDLFDFRAIRRNASRAEQSDSMAADVQCGLEFLRKFEPHIFLRGNHDERVWDVAHHTDNGLVRDAAETAIKDIKKTCRSIKCRMLPYDSRKGVYHVGRLSFIHGFHAGQTATKKHAEVYAKQGGCVLHGHTHSIQTAHMARLGGAMGMGVGCLADLNPEYNRHQTARLMHEHGFAYGVVGKKGWECFQAKPNTDGSWYVADTIVAL